MLIKLHERWRLRTALGPNDRRAIARHRQNRKRPRLEEQLISRPIVRLLMTDGRHDPRLFVRPTDRLDPHRLPQRRVATVSGNAKCRLQRTPVAERDLNMSSLHRRARYTLRRNQRESGHTFDRALQRDPEMPVLNHMSERRIAHLAMIEMQQRRRRARAHRAVADHDVQDRLRHVPQMLPKSKRLQHPPRSWRKRTHSPIECRIDTKLRIEPVDDDCLDSGFGKREPEREADHAPARDHNIRLTGHLSLTVNVPKLTAVAAKTAAN